MTFKTKQTVVVVPRETYYETLKSGTYRLATVVGTNKDSIGRLFYVAKLPNGEIVSDIVGGPYEFNSIDYVKSELLRFANEARSDAAFYFELAASLDA